MGENAMILSLAGTAFQHNTNCFASFRIAQLQNAQARLHDHSLLRLYVQWSAPSNENEVEWAKRATSLPRCSSTWDDSRNQPREGEFVHHCVACQRRMLIRSRSLSGHRTTLTSSVVRNPILVRCLVAAMSLR
jgi:hypothetical protein